MNKAIFDGHVHFNIKGYIDIDEFINHIKINNINRIMLIINNEIERKFFIKNMDRLIEKNIDVYLAILIEYNNFDSMKFLQMMDYLNIPYNIKIHPRISKIANLDFIKYLTILERLPEDKVIIIDSFPYGHEIEYHTGMELCIFLAKRLKNRKFVLAHSGGIEILKSILFTRNLKNIYYDLSLTVNYLFDTSVRKDIVNLIKYNRKRVMFGSDYPDFKFTDAIKNTIDLCEEAELNIEELNDVFYGNALNLYGESWREKWKI